jgi:multidrug resistance efflux pump
MMKLITISLGSLVLACSLAGMRIANTTTPNTPARELAAQQNIIASGIIQGRTEPIEVRAEANGRVQEVCVRAGEWVDSNQTLIRLDDRAEAAILAARLAELKVAEAKLHRLLNGARECERNEARAGLASQRARLRQAELSLKRTRQLRTANAVSAQEADDGESLVQTLSADVAAAAARLQRLEAPAREDEVEAAHASVAAARALYDAAQVVLDRMTVRSPTRAQVLDVNVRLGEMVSSAAAAPCIVLSDTSKWRVRTFVEEQEAPRLVLGARATVRATAFEGHHHAGVLTELSPQMTMKRVSLDAPNELYDTKVREVIVDLDAVGGSQFLIEGLRVDVEIDASEINPQRNIEHDRHSG